VKSPVIIAACFVFCLATSVIHSEEWTQFRGSDFNRTSETSIAERWDLENIAWKTSLPGRGASSPVVFGDRLYLTAFTGYAIEKATPGDPGKLVRHLLCIHADDGKVLWQKAVPDASEKEDFTNWGTAVAGYASSTPAVDEAGVYVFFGATGILAFNHEGTELWRTFCGDDLYPYPAGNSPVLHENLVIINASYECGDLIALRKSDGSEVWRQSGLEQSWNTPVIYKSGTGTSELAVAAVGQILSFDPNTGERLWTCAGFDEYVCPSITAQDGILYSLGGRKNKAIAVRSGGSGDVTESHLL
jgi:outer membrane protein assembly factor BamB